MKIELPDNLTDEQKNAIMQIILEHGGWVIDQVKQSGWQRLMDWWYRLVRTFFN